MSSNNEKYRLIAITVVKAGYKYDTMLEKSYNDEIYSELLKVLSKKDTKTNRYSLYKAIKMNYGQIKDLIENCAESSTDSFSTRFERVFSSVNINPKDSHYPKSGSFGYLCTILGTKNTLKNRFKLKRVYIRYKQKNREMRCSTPLPQNSDVVHDSSPNISEIFSEENVLPMCRSNGDLKNSKPFVDQAILSEMCEENNKDSVIRGRVCEKYDFNLDLFCSNNKVESDEDVPDKMSDIPVGDKDESLYQNVSNEEETINSELKRLYDQSFDNFEILPKGSENLKDSTWRRPSFKTCNVLEGTFILSHGQLESICVKNKLIRGQFNFVIRKKILTVNNICVFNIKHSRFVKRKNQIIVYGYCMHDCKVFILKINDISLSGSHVVEVFSSSINFNHLRKYTSHVRGIERKLLGNSLLSQKPLLKRQEDIKKVNKKLVSSGNLGDLKSDSVYRKIRSQQLAKNDRHEDDVLDLILMHKFNQNYIHSVGVPFFVYVFSREQLNLLMKEQSPILYLDSTGTIIKRPKSAKAKVYYYAGVITTKKKRVCSVMELITSSHDTGSIGTWLISFKIFAMKVTSHWPLFSMVVVDFSFALLNAVSLFWNNLTLLEYINKTFEVYNGNENFPKDLVKIRICCCHFFKMICKDINKATENQSRREFLKFKFAALFKMSNLDEILFWLKNIYIILMSESENESVMSAKNLLNGISMKFSFESLQFSDNFTQFPQQKEDELSLYKNSAYFKKFESSLLHIKFGHFDKKLLKNDLYLPDLAGILKKKYVPFIPLWCGISVDNRVSNAHVERYFGIIKNIVLKGEKNQKCSRVLRRIRQYTVSICKEHDLEIGPKYTRNKNYESRVLKNRETWHKSLVIPKYFESDSINNFSTVSNNNSHNLTPTCLDCGKANLDTTITNWVQCDMCLGWVHTVCDSTDDKSYSGAFTCKLCAAVKVVDNSISSSSPMMHGLPEQCRQFLNILKTVDSDELERQTRAQRKCRYWYDERKKRLTASNFGHVCKASHKKSLITLTFNLLYQKNLDSPAIKYGIENEQNAVRQYSMQTKNKVITSGIRTHPNYRYLACSPDGLVGSYGLIEVKCPYSIRDCDPKNAICDNLLVYMTSNGQLRKEHVYYYQIQGMLEILNRNWCDLIIYSKYGIAVHKIVRDKEFWSRMKPKLVFFYHNFLLPEIILGTRDKNLIVERNIHKFNGKQKLEFFPNGLVKSPNYYKSISREYVVCNYEELDYFLKELRISDIQVLDGTNWLSNFLIDITFHLLNNGHGNSFQIFDSHTSYKLFILDLNREHLKKLIFVKRFTVMPLLINNNHWCLVVIDDKNKLFSFLDPRGENDCQCKEYFEKFRLFVSDPCDWKLQNHSHVLQNDGYNCGIYIIFFFKQFLGGGYLVDNFNPDEFRVEVRNMLLESSSFMQDKCLICGSAEGRSPTAKCNLCHRIIHLKCIGTKCQGDYTFPFDFCDICIQYLNI